ncbi:glycoside hydrolase family 38 C-terminal domain-containing protein [Vagococcus zengguangii]|uniref:glycoside hydrolase family 38 N-terminal domain-containing protein n=1 Tax=Vagococcus zengguangii TaxID=2571750 RepID=UPI0011092CB3|nr:glycoside hydrolase family 38 C-terminal domain-containing protein [Vagococcus zengguangii]TLG78363.1 alpha-mannosidase [Vagococcus zengguangii]
MKKIHVVAHTHWDREWYFSDNEAFVQFSYHMDEVIYALENNELDYYYLDGQLSIVEDYLKIFPTKRENIKKLVEQNKLFIGPWYTQMDEFVVAGESVVKNLQIGMSLSEDLGGYTSLGYLPDSFGQGKDMPKIYQGFDIDHAVFWRGMPNEITSNREFFWEAEDGSKVLTINIRNGYYAGVALVEGDQTLQKSTLDMVSEDTISDEVVTLPVGGDQRAVDRQLKEIIAKANQELSGEYEIIESNYPHIFNILEQSKEKLPIVTGEFMSGSVSKIHRSIFSSRYDLKKINDTIENRLIFELQPLAVMADEMGIPYKGELIDYIWKLLLKNHAHDSIGGCNTDKTNRMIMARYQEADQLSYSNVDYLVRKISESLVETNENDVVVFNTLPTRRTEPFTIKISSKAKAITLVDKKRQQVPFEILNVEKVYAGEIRRSEEDYREDLYYYIYTLSVDYPLAAFNYSILQVKEHLDEIAALATTTTQSVVIENEFYRVAFENGEFNLTTKYNQKVYANCLSIEESGDEGDTYDYSPAYHDAFFDLTFKEASVSSQIGKLHSTIWLAGSWYVPKNLEERQQGLASCQLTYQLEVSLKQDTNRIELKLTIDNQADDHRMRLVFDSGIKTDVSYADTLFGTIERLNVDPHINDWRELGWKEEPTEIYPMIHFANVHNETASVSMLSKGIKEYQVQDNKLFMTLFRGVGFLGRPELLRRPGDASGNQFRYIPTPDSQLHGELTMELALVIEADYQPAAIQKNYQAYAIAPPYYQIQEINRFTNPIKYFQSNKVDHLNEMISYFDFSDLKLVVSSLELSKNGQWLHVRFNNPSLTKSVSETFELSEDFEVAWVNLYGVTLERLGVTKSISVEMEPGEIKTIAIKRKKRGIN